MSLKLEYPNKVTNYSLATTASFAGTGPKLFKGMVFTNNTASQNLITVYNDLFATVFAIALPAYTSLPVDIPFRSALSFIFASTPSAGCSVTFIEVGG